MAQEVEVTNWPWDMAGSAVSLGELGAAFLSYAKWHCIVLAIGHGACSWVYILYYLIRYGVH